MAQRKHRNVLIKPVDREDNLMLPGRKLINEIEQTLSDLDTVDWQLSGKLEDYILEHGDYFLDEWRDIKRSFSDKSTRVQLSLILDVIQSEAYSEREKLQARVDILDEIDDELEDLIEFDEDDLFGSQMLA